jgi:hypothetical protein
MIIEIDGQVYNSTETLCCPDWWDKWQEENFNRKVISFSKRFKQLEQDQSDSE